MSDNSKVLEHNLGTPLVWLKSSEGNVVLDIDDKPIIRFITDFKYIYDEENDDECSIRFQFPSSQYCDSIFFKQDSVLIVQWGYITPGGNFIKSPERKIALRDKKTKYTDKGIQLDLECTDLISYIKNIKTNTVRENTNLVDFIKEVADGKFKATITTHGFITLIGNRGTVRSFEFDEKKNAVSQVAVDNARFESRAIKLDFKKVIKGKSLSINNAIKDLTSNIPDGPYIQDTTDDVLEIKARNFNQDVFKTFTYAGGTGELLNFQSKTDTRKVKEDVKYTARVDPKKKTVEKKEISTGNTAISNILSKQYGTNKEKPNQEEIDVWLQNVQNTFDYNVANPNTQKDIPELSYQRTVITTEAYMGRRNIIEKIRNYSLPAREILNDPDLEGIISNNKISNYSIENLQKKYEADASVIGDPYIIKGRIYLFKNLSKDDTGLWYSVRVTHNISKGSYLTELELIKKPLPIVIADNTNTKTLELNDDTGEVEESDETINTDSTFYSPFINDNDNSENINTNQEEQTKKRIDYLLSGEDYVKTNPDYKTEFDVDKTEIDGINQSTIENLNKPNNEQF